jgi:isopenicillin-N epimerase
MREHWLLDPEITYLTHGTFGAAPIAVLAKQDEFRTQLEREPVRFMIRELEPLLDDARAQLGEFIGADPAGIAFLPNATAGVNAVCRSLDLDKNDEIIVSTQEYNASRNIAEFFAQLAGARVVLASVPFPLASPDETVALILEKITDRTRLVLVDHVTSQTALVMPVERIVREVQSRGIDVLVDGAHAPGMVPLDLRALNAAYYTANLHKWVCAPKGAAFLYARENRRAAVRPVAISHGANSPRTDRSRYHLEFDWTGTFDPTPWLCVPESLRFMQTLVAGGWPEIMRRNRALALRARDIICARLGIAPPAPDEMIGSMAAFPLPDGLSSTTTALNPDPLQDALFFEFKIEVPIMPWPAPPNRLLRISAQLYNEEREYEQVANAVRILLERERR